jgi:hypothetical protein
MGQSMRWSMRQDARECGLKILPASPSIHTSWGASYDFPAQDLSVLDPGEAEYIAERQAASQSA